MLDTNLDEEIVPEEEVEETPVVAPIADDADGEEVDAEDEEDDAEEDEEEAE